MDSRKRNFVGNLMAAGVLGSVATSLSAPAIAAAVPGAGNLLRVGAGLDFSTIQDAVESISDASSDNPYAVLVAPGRYPLADAGRPLVMRPWVNVVGIDRNSVFIETDATANVICASDACLGNLTITGSDGPLVENRTPSIEDVLFSNVQWLCNGPGPALLSRQYVSRIEIRDCQVQTQGVGFDFSAGGRIYIHDTNIHLFGASSGPHVGIRASSYCRIFVFGGKIGTGYGYGEVTNTSEDVIGVHAEPGFDGRIVMHGVWSICRNNGAPAGVNINCIRVDDPKGWIRIFGGYYQAENDIGQGRPKTITNPGLGKIELYGTRVLHYGEGPTYSTNQIGLQRYSKADDGRVLYRGGLLLFNAQAGAFTVKLPWAMPTEQYILKKVDSSANPVTIQGNGYRIDGQTSVVLSSPYDKVHLRFDGSNYLIVG